VKTSIFHYPFSTPIFEAEFQASVASTLNGKFSAKYGYLTGAPVSKNFSLLDLMCSAALAGLRLSNAQSPADTKHAEYSPSFGGGNVQLGGTC